ncbi:hypothetical protein BS17DRAFT_821161 [Gyrodon lividus]|nr:hypothetical protein BS17DRAFT_821161 [Gyrodon lividus]
MKVYPNSTLSRKHFLVLGDYAYRWAELAVQVAKLKSHFNADTLPAFIKGTKAPTVQILKEARVAAPEKVKLLEDNHKAYLEKQLQAAIGIKEAELTEFSGRCMPKTYLPIMYQQLNIIYTGVKEIASVPSFVKQADGSYIVEETMGDDTGEHTTWAQTQFNTIRSELPAMCMRVIAIKCTQAQALARKSEAKRTVQQHAKAAVGDALPDQKSITAMIRKEVATVGKAPKSKAKMARIMTGPPKKEKAKPAKAKKAAAATGKKQQQTSGSRPKNSKRSKSNKGKGKAKA